MRERISSDKPYHHDVARNKGDDGDHQQKTDELPGTFILHATTAIQALLWRVTL
jgi:hypothetical protein